MAQFTRCPHCDTAFMVTEEQLAIAQGRVRCGNCKEIFVAVEPSIEQETQELETQELETQELETQELETQELETQELETQEQETQEQETQELLNIPVLLETGQIIEQSFEDDDQIKVVALTEADFSPNNEETEPELLSPNSEPVGDNVQVSDDSDKVHIAMAATEDYQASVEAAYEKPLSEEEAFALSLDNLDLAESDPEAREQAVEQAVNEEKGGSLLKQFSWLFGSLIILIAIIGSIFWFKRFELAADPNWRPLVDTICDHVPCGIPTQRDVSLIELRSREVTVEDNSVKINMILLNKASFVQPYPRIDIEFSDIDGNTLAVKTKLPTQYLRADMVNKPMSSGVPVHIEFSINMATEEVVGYVFRFQ